ncbi:MAG: hypothetical protein ACRD6W_09390, partial [Nitrososphaerales archaeon]
VLRPGGVAGFSEPGPHHSRDPQSQHEMRRYGVPELDLVLEEIWRAAAAAGFAELSVGIFTPTPQWVPFDRFNSFLGLREGSSSKSAPARPLPRYLGRAARLFREFRSPEAARASLSHVEFVRTISENRRMFLMRKEGSEVTDSREASGLAAELRFDDVRVSSRGELTHVTGACHIRNAGRNRWLASSAGQGAVLLGLRLGRGEHPAADHGRVALPGDVPVEPGEEVVLSFSTDVPTPQPGEDPLRLEIDLVSEGITWFANVRGRPFEIDIEPSRQ